MNDIRVATVRADLVTNATLATEKINEFFAMLESDDIETMGLTRDDVITRIALLSGATADMARAFHDFRGDRD